MSALLDGLVIDHDYTKGTLRDFSPNTNDGIMTSGEVFCRQPKGNAVVATRDTAYVVVADDASLDLDAFTFVFYGHFYEGFPSTAYLLDRSNGVNIDIQLRVSSANTLTLDDGAFTRTLTVNPSDIKTKSVLIITKAAGASNADAYIDGVFHGSFTGTTNITSNGYNVTLFATQAGASHLYTPMYSFLMYNKAKTAVEIAEIYDRVKGRITDRSSKRNFKNEEKRNRISSGYAWNMDINDLSNRGPDSANLSIIGTANKSETLWGESAIEFNALSLLSGSGYLSGGDIPGLRFTTESFGGGIWVKIRDLSSFNPILMMKGSPSVSGFHLQCTGGVVAFATSQSGANQQALGIPSIHENVWQLVTFFSEAGGNNEVWINGQEGGFPIARINPDSSSGYNYTIGRHSTSTVGYIDGFIARPFISEFSSRNEFLSWQEKELKTVGRNLIYREDFRDAYVHNNYYSGANITIPGTELINDLTGATMKITDHDDVGDKRLYGGAFASACTTHHDGHPYGTWVYKFNHTAGQRTRFGIYADEPKNIAANHLVIDGTGGGLARIEVVVNGANQMYSANGIVPTGENEIKVVIKPYGSNNLSVYLNGSLVTPAYGTNPMTLSIDRNKFKYYVYAPYTTSSINEVKHYFGDI